MKGQKQILAKMETAFSGPTRGLEDIGKLISMEQVSGLCEQLFKIGTASVFRVITT